ncbi:hypothetical protein WJ16_20770 [Burkholderia metallica]|nr:hypothetical protein WJ16_20770 [Burkholderia metallica]
MQVQTIAEYEPVVFDAKCVERVRRATAAAGCPYMEMCSGAGHDAVNLSFVAPSATVPANLLADCAR